MQKVRIESDGTGTNTSVKDENGNPIAGAYAFEVRGHRQSAFTKATVFCFQTALDVTTDAEIVNVPAELLARAKKIAGERGTKESRDAFRELLGVEIPAKE